MDGQISLNRGPDIKILYYAGFTSYLHPKHKCHMRLTFKTTVSLTLHQQVYIPTKRPEHSLESVEKRQIYYLKCNQVRRKGKKNQSSLGDEKFQQEGLYTPIYDSPAQQGWLDFHILP